MKRRNHNWIFLTFFGNLFFWFWFVWFVLTIPVHAYDSSEPEFWDEWWTERSWVDLRTGRTETVITVNYPFNAFQPDKHFHKILQMGAGDGSYLAWLIKEKNWSCDEYIAVDFSQKAIELLQAREVQGDFGTCKLTPIKSYAQMIPQIADSSIDMVLGFHGILHLDFEDKEEAMTEIARILKTEGSLYLMEEFNEEEATISALISSSGLAEKLEQVIVLHYRKFSTLCTDDLVSCDIKGNCEL